MMTAVVPYRDAPLPEAPEPGRKAPPPIPTGVTREGIKATNKVCDVVTSSVRNLNEITRLVDGVDTQKRRAQKTPGSEDLTARDTLGMAVRRWGPTWRSQVMYALLVELVDHRDNVDGKCSIVSRNPRICANDTQPSNASTQHSSRTYAISTSSTHTP
jgi:tRNA nucleotidyltransferase (CCA-adding enzyme)